MSRDDADFAAYLAARWTPMVRAVVLLTGLPRRDAQDRVRDAFARCLPAWSRIRSEDDVDTQVWEVVRRDRPTPLIAGDPVREPVLVALETALDRLDRTDPGAREVVVLEEVSGLDEVQVAELLDLGVSEVRARSTRARARLDLDDVRSVLGRDGLLLAAGEALRLAAETIETGAAPYDEVVARARETRRRRMRHVAAGVAVAAVVVGGLTWIGTRTSSPPGKDVLGPVPVTRERNPVDVAWFADGVLHLDDATLRMPHLTDLVEAPGGAVYADTRGTVAFVGADGQRQLLGHLADASPLLGSRTAGRVAWVDRDAGLVVDDLTRGVLTALPGPPQRDAVPVVVDGDTVYYRLHGQTYRWQPESNVIGTQPRLRLLDRAASATVYQIGSRIEIVQPSFRVDHLRPGIGAEVSGGGVYALTAAPGGDLPLGSFRPVLYNVRTGARVSSGFGGQEVALDATFGDGSTVVYVAATVDDLEQAVRVGAGEPEGTLRSCTLEGRCTDVAVVGLGGGEPLLAH